MTTVVSNYWFMAYCAALGATIILILIRNTYNIDEIAIKTTLILTVIALSLIYNDVNGEAVKFVLFLILAVAVTLTGTKEGVLLTIIKVNYFLIAISLPLYLGINILGLGLPSYSFVNVNDVAYHSIFIYNWFDGFLSFRNAGFYWEPGLLATHIVLTAIIMHRYNLLSVTHRVVLTTVLITTFSIFGIVASLFLLNKYWKKNLQFLLVFFLAVIFVEFASPGAVSEYSSIITRKFFIDSASVTDRLTSHAVALQIWLDQPLGIGIGNFYSRFERTGTPFTSSVLGLAAAYPLLLIALFLSFALRIYRQGFREMLLIGVVVLAANKEPVLYSMLFIIICVGFYDARTRTIT